MGGCFFPPSRARGSPPSSHRAGCAERNGGSGGPMAQGRPWPAARPLVPAAGRNLFPLPAWAAERGQYNSTASLAPWGGPRLASIGLMESRQRRNRDLRHGRRSLPVMSRGYKPGRHPFTREAISSAKFSCFFSMPSPFSNRTAVLKVIAPPSSLAAWAI